MFEAIQNAAQKIPGNESTVANVLPLKPQPAASVSNGTQSAEQTQQPSQTAEPVKATEDKIDQRMLDELEQDIEAMHNIGLQFSVHEKSGRTMIKVMDKESSDIIREIPPKTVLDLAAKMDEMLGILFDSKV